MKKQKTENKRKCISLLTPHQISCEYAHVAHSTTGVNMNYAYESMRMTLKSDPLLFSIEQLRVGMDEFSDLHIKPMFLSACSEVTH